MSKKHSKQQYSGTVTPPPPSLSASHAAEYRIIRHDLIRVVALNMVYLAAVLILYYSNQKSHYLDNLLSHWLHY